jgi:hypothetical protein
MKFIYIDDSSIRIESLDHLILAALIVKDPIRIFDDVSIIRRKNKIKQYEEFKLASALINNENDFLQDIIGIITSNTETCLCVIDQTLDKKVAASLLIGQIIDYYSVNSQEEVYLLFDKGIVDGSFIKTIQEKDINNIIVGFQSLDSKYDYGIQIADWFVTQFKTFLAFSLKGMDKSITISDTDCPSNISYRFFSSMALRYHWWGDVLNVERKNEFDLEQSPYKYIVGKGILVRSTQDVKTKIEEIITVFMGCIH